MKRILLALAILGAGATGYLAARHSTIRLEHEANVTREAWLTQSQLVATAQREQTNLTERARELKQALAQMPALADNAPWCTLRSNRAAQLPPELRERALGELGFNWQSSADYIAVTKQTLRDTGPWMFRNGELSEAAATVLAMTPEERGQVAAALEQAKADFHAWALAHAERRELNEGELAHYFLPGDPATLHSIRSNISALCSAALGRERAGLMQPSLRAWMDSEIGLGAKGASLIIKRELVGTEPRLKAEIDAPGIGVRSGHLPQFALPAAFRPIFPNGWADVAQLDGFELAPQSESK